MSETAKILLKAFNEGKTIQEYCDGNWFDLDKTFLQSAFTSHVMCLLDFSKLRVKPKEKYRYFNSEELLFLFGEPIRRICLSGIYSIQSLLGDRVSLSHHNGNAYSDGTISLADFVENYEYYEGSEWKRCTVKTI